MGVEGGFVQCRAGGLTELEQLARADRTQLGCNLRGQCCHQPGAQRPGQQQQVAHGKAGGLTLEAVERALHLQRQALGGRVWVERVEAV